MILKFVILSLEILKNSKLVINITFIFTIDSCLFDFAEIETGTTFRHVKRCFIAAVHLIKMSTYWSFSEVNQTFA